MIPRTLLTSCLKGTFMPRPQVCSFSNTAQECLLIGTDAPTLQWFQIGSTPFCASLINAIRLSESGAQ